MDLITKRIPLREALLPDWAMKAAKDHGAEGEEVHVVRKGLVPEDTKFKEKERASVDYITTKSIDRDGEIILPGGNTMWCPTGQTPLQVPHCKQARIRAPFSTSSTRRSRVASVNVGETSAVTVIYHPLSEHLHPCELLHKDSLP